MMVLGWILHRETKGALSIAIIPIKDKQHIRILTVVITKVESFDSRLSYRQAYSASACVADVSKCACA